MAGKIIVDTLDTDNSFITLNVQQATVATMNANGIFSRTGTKMIGSDGTIGAGVITASQLATSLNLATNNVQVASIQSATGTPAITFAANGQMTLANTPLQLTGGQIKFPSTQIASADGNTLDDYEEGTWIPKHSDGTDMTTNTVCPYVKIGTLVWVNYDVTATKSTVAVHGLPFTAGTSIVGGNYSGYLGYETLSTTSPVYTHISQGSSIIEFFAGSAGVTIANGERVIGGSIYRTA